MGVFLFVFLFLFFLTFHKYIRHIVLFLDTYGSCSPENPDDNTYKDVIIYVYVPLIFKKKTVKKTRGEYKPSARQLLPSIVSP